MKVFLKESRLTKLKVRKIFCVVLSIFGASSLTLASQTYGPVLPQAPAVYQTEEDADVSRAARKVSLELADIFDGTQVGLRYRLQRIGSEISHNRIQFQVRIKAEIPLSDKVSLHVQPQTQGDSFSSGWSNLVNIDDASEIEFDLKLRRLYLEGKPTERFTWQVGALQTRTGGLESTPLTLDSDGWIDGGRIIMTINKSSGDFSLERISITGGALDPTEGNVFARKFDIEENPFAQVQIQGAIAKKLKLMAEYNKIGPREYVRANFSFDVREHLGAIASSLFFEEVHSVGADPGQDFRGRSFGVTNEGKNWKGTIAFVNNQLSRDIRSLVNAPTRELGKQLLFDYEHSTQVKGLSWSIRHRQCLKSETCQGFRLELRLIKRFSAK